MGEKGNVASIAAMTGAAAGASDATQSLVERTTTRTTESVVDVGQDYADVVREKLIGSAADHTIDEARDRVTHRGAGEGDTGPIDEAATSPDED